LINGKSTITLHLGCAGIFASKRNEAKLKRNFFRFEAKKKVSFASFRFEAKWKKGKRNGSETVKDAKRIKATEAKRAKRNKKEAKKIKKQAKCGEKFKKSRVM